MRILKRIVEMVFIFLVPLMLLLFGLKINKVYDDNNNLTSQYLTYENGIFREYNDNIHYKNILNYKQLFNMKRDIINTNSYNVNYLNNYLVNISTNNINTNEINIRLNNVGILNYTSGDILAVLSPYNTDNSNNYLCFRFFSDDYTTTRNFIDIGFNSSANSTSWKIIQLTGFNNIIQISFVKWSGISNYNINIPMQLVNLTKMFGNGYEPSTSEELEEILPLDKYYEFNYSEDFIIYSNNVISSYNYINYTWYNNALVSLSDHLQFNNNYMIQFIFIYVILIMLNLLLWYVFYVPFDMLFGLLLRKLEYYK